MIKEMKIDFSKYSKEQLVESFESVDDEKYPENALEIYKLLRSKVDTDSELIDERYTHGNVFFEVIEAMEALLIFPTTTTPSRAEIEAKLIRVQSLEEQREA